jgi:hypothetical protein
VKTTDASGRDAAQQHATFLRAVLALDRSDPNLPQIVPPPAALPEGDAPAPQTPN